MIPQLQNKRVISKFSIEKSNAKFILRSNALNRLLFKGGIGAIHKKTQMSGICE
jgi:hypothetical protein